MVGSMYNIMEEVYTSFQASTGNQMWSYFRTSILKQLEATFPFFDGTGGNPRPNKLEKKDITRLLTGTAEKPKHVISKFSVCSEVSFTVMMVNITNVESKLLKLEEHYSVEMLPYSNIL